MNSQLSLMIFVTIVVSSCCCLNSVFARNPVENVHLAITGNYTVMVVSWKTSNNASSAVMYGTSSGKYMYSASGWSDSYSSSSGFNHNVMLTGLNASTTYYYICGDPSGSMSSEFNFTTQPASFQSFRMAIYGDLGTDNSQNTINCLNSRALNNQVDLFWHLGDISYANDHPLQYEKTWDKWFASMEPATAHKPYMTSVGNHESWCRNPICARDTANFTTYKEKFRMPGPESGTNTNMFYSYDYGNVHFISISTESDYPHAPLDPSPYSGWRADEEYFQVNWLLQDLERAQQNRKNVPWIVVGGHRPIYCAVDGEQTNGVPKRQAARVQDWLEPLFQQYQVDLFFTGHAHLYSRAYPTYQNKPTQFNFTNPTSTVYVVAGGAGNREGLQKLSNPQPSWAAGGLDTEYGYGIMQVWNNTCLTWSYYRADTDALYDSFTLVKQQHP